MVLRGTGGGEKQSLLTEYKGGGYKTLTANEGIIKILQRFGGGGHKVNFCVIRQKSSNPSLGNIYSDWSQTWQSLHGWQYTKK